MRSLSVGKSFSAMTSRGTEGTYFQPSPTIGNSKTGSGAIEIERAVRRYATTLPRTLRGRDVPVDYTFQNSSTSFCVQMKVRYFLRPLLFKILFLLRRSF